MPPKRHALPLLILVTSLIRVAFWDGVMIHRNFDRVKATGKITALDLEGSTNTSVTENRWVNALDDQCPDGVC